MSTIHEGRSVKHAASHSLIEAGPNAFEMEEQVSSDVLEDLRTLTVDELSRATGIQQWRLYAMLKDGTAPPFIRIGTTYRFPILGVRTWLAQRSAPSASTVADQP